MGKRNQSSSTLGRSGMISIEDAKLPKTRKLSASSGNLHGHMAEDYHQVNWPLPKAFGQERYGFSLIDIDDPRYIKECAGLSKKLIRLHYDQQIVDNEWRNRYKALLDSEHKYGTLPPNASEKTKTILKNEVTENMKKLTELQHQKDLYQQEVNVIYERCDGIKSTIKKENDLEELRGDMEKHTKDKIHHESPFWRTKFNAKTQFASSQGRLTGVKIDLQD